MSIRHILVLFVTLLLPGLLYAGDKSCDELIRDSERLWLEDRYVESNRALDEAAGLCPERAEIYWRKGRNNYDILEHIPREQRSDKDALIEKYREIENLGKKCVELDPGEGSCYLWHAIGMGRRGTTQGILNSLSEIDDMEGLMLKAITLKPAYRAEDGTSNAMADACHVLGQFYRVVPDWKFLEWVFGARGDIDKSVKLQRMAMELEPERIEYTKELGVSLMCRGTKTGNQEDIEDGKRHLEKIKDLPVIKPSDLIDKEHVKELLANPGMACGYSRDEQQEVSKEAYDKKEK